MSKLQKLTRAGAGAGAEGVVVEAKTALKSSPPRPNDGQHPSLTALLLHLLPPILQSSESVTTKKLLTAARCLKTLVCRREFLIRFMPANSILRTIFAPPKLVQSSPQVAWAMIPFKELTIAISTAKASRARCALTPQWQLTSTHLSRTP